MQSSLFAGGFRRTFLAAGIAALLLVPLWVLIWGYGVALPGGWPPTLWHAHEMVFGFVVAAIAGFLLTAVPSWTGQRGFAGAPLLVLTTLWVCGRVLIATANVWLEPVVMVTDVAFLVLLVLAMFAACNATFHWALMRQNPPLALHAILISVIPAGRSSWSPRSRWDTCCSWGRPWCECSVWPF